MNKNTLTAILLAMSLLSTSAISSNPIIEPDSGIISELRLGVLAHDAGKNFEEGQDINAEVLFNSPDNAFFNFLFSPRPHIGASINLSGATNQFYVGFTWQWVFLDPCFVEFNFGGEAHDGETSERSSKSKALGSRLLFREGISLGVTIADHHTLSVMLDHASNASLSDHNPGLTNLGVRYGYKF